MLGLGQHALVRAPLGRHACLVVREHRWAGLRLASGLPRQESPQLDLGVSRRVACGNRHRMSIVGGRPWTARSLINRKVCWTSAPRDRTRTIPRSFGADIGREASGGAGRGLEHRPRGLKVCAGIHEASPAKPALCARARARALNSGRVFVW